MVSYCCVKGCGNNSNNKKKNPNSVISFHAFPSNHDVKTKWLRAIGRPNWVPPNHARICSAHFDYNQINYDGCKIRVKDDAFPVNSLPPTSNFEASHVEACRICLDTNNKLCSLQDSKLAICMQTLAGSCQNGLDLEVLPQYVCSHCAQSLIQCNQLIEKCMMSQATLLDIFSKNGQITKNLIDEHNRTQMNLKSPSDKSTLNCLSKFDEFNTSQLTDSTENINFKNEIDTNLQTVIEDLNKEYKTEIIEHVFSEEDNNDVQDIEIASSAEDITPNEDLDKNLSSGDMQKEKNAQVKQLKTRVNRNKANGLTPDETNMQKYFNIVKLSLHEQIEEWQKATVRRPLNSESIYRCEICNKTFANITSCRIHISYHDPSLGDAECPVCKLRFKNSVLATSHAKRAHSKKFYCKICPKAFSNAGVAKKHQRWHSGYLYKCSRCPFSTVHESSLGAHRRRAHRTAHAHTNVKASDITKDYRCEQCDINFTSEGARRVHILTSSQHSMKPDLCDASLQDAGIRNSCNKCGTECSSLKDLVIHVRAEHPRSRRNNQWKGDTAYPVGCELCGETIASRKKHWQHVRRQHPKNIDTYQPVITAICDTCGKGFQNSTKLRLHQLRHGSPTLGCASCARLFYDKYALARHARSHAADKPHRCRTCGRAFKLLSNLDRHFRVHTDVAPYECTICSKKFKHSSSVNLHVRTVHYKLPHPTRKKRSKSVKDVTD